MAQQLRLFMYVTQVRPLIYLVGSPCLVRRLSSKRLHGAFRTEGTAFKTEYRRAHIKCVCDGTDASYTVHQSSNSMSEQGTVLRLHVVMSLLLASFRHSTQPEGEAGF